MGELIFEALRRLDINQRQLGERLGVSAPAISRWVSGRDTPDYESCLRLAKAIGVPAIRVLVLAGRDPDLLPDDPWSPWVAVPYSGVYVVDHIVPRYALTDWPRKAPGQHRSA